MKKALAFTLVAVFGFGIYTMQGNKIENSTLVNKLSLSDISKFKVEDAD